MRYVFTHKLDLLLSWWNFCFLTFHYIWHVFCSFAHLGKVSDLTQMRLILSATGHPVLTLISLSIHLIKSSPVSVVILTHYFFLSSEFVHSPDQHQRSYRSPAVPRWGEWPQESCETRQHGHQRKLTFRQSPSRFVSDMCECTAVLMLSMLWVFRWRSHQAWAFHLNPEIWNCADILYIFEARWGSFVAAEEVWCLFHITLEHWVWHAYAEYLIYLSEIYAFWTLNST